MNGSDRVEGCGALGVEREEDGVRWRSAGGRRIRREAALQNT
jgi:hypothetical protein